MLHGRGPRITITCAAFVFGAAELIGSPAVALTRYEQYRQTLAYSYPHRGRLDISTDALGHCMALAAAARGPVSFARDGMRDFSTGRACEYTFSNFLSYLVAGNGSGVPCSYSSGTEAELERWVRAQPDNSIDPVGIFRASLSINGGNAWLALLAIHRMLWNNARPGEMNYPTTDQSRHAFFDKLVDLRGDLSELGGENRGDHAGTWYRIWGMMLFRLMLEDGTSLTHKIGAAAAQCETGGSLLPPEFLEVMASCSRWITATVVGSGAEWIKVLGYPEKDRRKAEINRDGASSMDAMLMRLRHPVFRPGDSEACARRAYLR